MGSESGGNDSDNSLEEPSSLSETRPLNRNSHLRQSLQRKPATDMKLLESSLMRGGAVRSSLHTLTSNNNTSTPTRRIEKPAAPQPPQLPPKEAVGQTTTDVANVVNLGGAGSRRTVYLVDGNQIKAERSPTSSINLGQPANATTTSSEAANSSTQSTNGATIASGAEGAATPPATTLLMYNRISNIIAPLSEGSAVAVGQSEKFGSSTGGSQNDSNKGSMEDKEKESAIWYEYGCV